MEENAQPRGKDSALSPGWHWRLALAILIYGGLIVVSYWDGVGPLWLRIAICFACMFTAGFWTGFRPHSEDRRLRVTFYHTVVLGNFVALQLPTAHLAGIYSLPADQRYGAMLTPRYIGLYAALLATYALSYPLGEKIYRRRHPDTATIPATPEDLEWLDTEASPQERRSLIRMLLLVPLAFAPSFLAILFWPDHCMRIMIANVALVGGVFSFRLGYQWEQMECRMRRFALILAYIGPPAGFIGFVEHGGVAGAFLFAGKIAVVLIVPGIVGRLIVGYRTGDAPS